MIKFIKDKQSFEGKILLVCGISAGYVPTFALDNLITLNAFQRVAFFQSKFLEPSVGYLPKDIEDGALGLPAELYLSGDVAILQFRSVVRFGRKKQLCQEIYNFVKIEKIADVIILASLPFAIRPDRQIQSLQKNIYYKQKGILGQRIMIDKCIELGLVRPVEELKDEDQKQEIILNHAGLTNALLKDIDNLLVLLMFNEEAEDKDTGVYFSTQIYKIVDQKEVSIIK